MAAESWVKRLVASAAVGCVLVAGVVEVRPAAAALACDGLVVQRWLDTEPTTDDDRTVRSDALRAALACTDGVRPLLLGFAAYELAVEAYQAPGDALARTEASLEYLARADAELLRADEGELWLQIRLSRVHMLEDVAELRASRAPLDEGRNLIAELLRREPENATSPDVLERTLWLESALRLWRAPDSWERAMSAIKIALRSEGLVDEVLRTDFSAQRAILLSLGPTDRPPTLSERQAGIRAHERAIADYETLNEPEKALRERINLAFSLTRMPGLDDLERATELARDVAAAATDPTLKGSALIALGNAYFHGATGDSETSNEQAILAYREAVAILPPEAGSAKVKAQFDLVLALSSSSIETAIRLAEAEQRVRSLLSQVGDQDRPRAMQLLGTVLLAEARTDSDLLEAAEHAIADAAASSDLLEPDQQLGLLGDMAELAQLKMGLREGQGLGEVEAVYQRAISSAAQLQQWRIWASFQNNLGNLYSDSRRPELVPLARRAYEAALTVRTAVAFPTEHVDTITNLASLNFTNGQWREAAEAYTTVLNEHLDLFQAMDGEIRQAALESSKRRFERAAFSLAREDQLWDALAVVELGRARALKARLGESVEQEGLASAMEWRPDAPPKDTLVLVPVVTTQGTLILGLMTGTEGTIIKSLFLESFDADNVVEHVAGLDGWLSSYEASTNVSDATVDIGAQVAQVLPEGIDAVNTWLGEAFSEPVLQWAKGAFDQPFSRIALSVQGELAILPIHSSMLADGTPLLADYEISYMPSLVFLAGSGELHSPFGALVAVSNPSVDERLPVSNLEAKVATAVWQGPVQEIAPSDVTPAMFMSSFRSADTLLFVGHGKYDASDPLQSYIVMSGGEHLTVSEIQGGEGVGAPRLLILSACETGIVGVRLASNEYEGLAGAFLALGADGVIATLWPVNEYATMLLMGHFYSEVSQGERPSLALANAQNWLANAPAAELLTMVDETYMPLAVRDNAARGAMANFRAYLSSKGQERVFSSPYYWAGLIFTGALEP